MSSIFSNLKAHLTTQVREYQNEPSSNIKDSTSKSKIKKKWKSTQQTPNNLMLMRKEFPDVYATMEDQLARNIMGELKKWSEKSRAQAKKYREG